MKNLILLLFISAALSSPALSQQEVSKEISYVRYQDSLFIAKEVIITNVGIDGINDTIVRYLPPALDSSGLVNTYLTGYINESNQVSSKLRNAKDYRKVNILNNQFGLLVDEFGSDLDSLLIATYANQLKGRYRYFDNLGNDRFFDLEDHPNRSDVLRMNEDGGANENWNVTVFNRWRIRIRIDGKNVDFLWNGEDRDRPVFRLEQWFLPTTAVDNIDTSRLIKLN